MRKIVGFLLLCFALPALEVGAQELTLRSPEIAGRVVEESGAPVQGAIVVARWNLLFYRAALHGSGWYANGDALHIAEAVTDRDGRYTLPAWGPKARAAARLEPGAPVIAVFRSGFDPSEGREPNVTLRRATEDAAHAERVRNFQEKTLAWFFPGDNWKSMPRMVDTMQAEKARLSDNGKPVRGANVIPGREGTGRVVDANGAIVSNGTIAIAWTLRRADGSPGTRRFVNARRLGTDQPDIQFYVSPFRLPGPRLPPGWEINPKVEPEVAIYVKGYRPVRVAKWKESGGTIRLEKLPEGRDGALQYLRAIRADLDRDLAVPDREVAFEGAKQLMFEFHYECGQLTPDLRKGLCFDPDSEMGRAAERSRLNPVMYVERWDNVDVMKVVAVNSGRAVGNASAPAGYFPTQRIPVSGFSIEPVQ